MKKVVIISITIVLVTLLGVIVFLIKSDRSLFRFKMCYIKKEKIEKITARYYYGAGPELTDDLENTKDYIEVDIEDNELIKEISKSIQGKLLIENRSSSWSTLYQSSFRKYIVKLTDNLSFSFDPSAKDDIWVWYKSENDWIRTRIDSRIVDKIRETLKEHFLKDTSVLETEKIEIYNYKEDYALSKEITDVDEIETIIKYIDVNSLENVYNVNYDRAYIKENLKLQDTYYEINFNEFSSLYIDNDFAKAYLLKYAYYIPGLNEIAYAIELTNLDRGITEFIELENTEDYYIIESGLEAEGIVAVEENSLSNYGIRLNILRTNYERYKDNDFIIYKEVDGNWEELEAYVESDTTTVTKSSEINIERINWLEKYGVLESGKYKIERTIFIQGQYDEVKRETKYFVIFEIKS